MFDIHAGNTAHKMKEDGFWSKVGKKHYIHVSGMEVTYDCNRWVWCIDGVPSYTLLWVTKYEVERIALEKVAGKIS